MTRSTFITGTATDLIILTSEYIETMQGWMNDHAVTQYLSAGAWPMYLQGEQAWLESLPKDGHLHLGIWHKRDQKLIGSCGLHEIDHIHQLAELGIVIGEKDYWGQGVGREAITRIVQHGFDWLNLRHITLRVLGNNPRAQGLYEQCGFVHTGTIPEHVLKAGQWVDEVHMLCRRDEWNQSEADTMKQRINHMVTSSQ